MTIREARWGKVGDGEDEVGSRLPERRIVEVCTQCDVGLK
jgi:hypothetical protein